MSTKRVVALRIDPTLWDELGDLIEKMKKEDMLGPDDTKSSIVRGLVEGYILLYKPRLEKSDVADDIEYVKNSLLEGRKSVE